MFISPDDIKEGMLQKFHIHETLNRPRANLCILAVDAAFLLLLFPQWPYGGVYDNNKTAPRFAL